VSAEATRPEVWAGIECTYNRVGDEYRDQLAELGHYDRSGDIDRLAALGVSGIRYPVLWERHAHDADAAWRTTDRALARMRELGVTPMVALMHHGSGPRHTSLLSPDFAPRLARFAAEVASRYPWLRRFVPVNEPLSTARFAALYGHWHPHRRDDESFAHALVKQALGIQSAMLAIRRIIPDAELVLSEDMGQTHATPRLQYQADFENERRWLSFDLLCGRVRPGHRMWRFLAHWPDIEEGLEQLLAAPCPPQLIGLNHYVTSERWLDERVELYAGIPIGGNGRHRYVDIEAVRAPGNPAVGPRSLLSQAWERYHLPVAITEAHLAGTREQQLRWFHRIWTAACELRSEGADVRAVQAWSAFGAFDWASLVTRRDGAYESGLFDVRSPAPRRTALASMVCSLASTGAWRHPTLDGAGWWEHGRSAGVAAPRHLPAPILVTGAAGVLGRAIAAACEERGLHYVTASRRQCDVADPAALDRWLSDVAPWAVVNAAGHVRVDDAEEAYRECFRANIDGPAALADACHRRGIALLTFSSDLVFGHGHDAPIVESAAPSPLSAYGWSKAHAERRVLQRMPEAMVVRTAAFVTPDDDGNFAARVLRALERGEPVRAADDVVVSPTYVRDLAHLSLDLLIDGERGLWHLANRGEVTWAELARRTAEIAGLDGGLVLPTPARELGYRAERPRYSALGSERATLMPTLDDALARCIAAYAARGANRPDGAALTAAAPSDVLAETESHAHD
jgi:dTDP-4-dehydrorhamnose reductase